jgi:hypothetical protein
MPLVTIDLLEGRTAQQLDEISDAVHEAMVEHLDVPRRDRFQIISQHPLACCASTAATSTSRAATRSC